MVDVRMNTLSTYSLRKITKTLSGRGKKGIVDKCKPTENVRIWDNWHLQDKKIGMLLSAISSDCDCQRI